MCAVLVRSCAARRRSSVPPIALVIALLAAALGFVFSAVSTYDFAAHLDRQVHGLHCSFIPGLGTPDITGTSGCHATLMSPYSSFLRESLWGGIPISLLSMAVFAFLMFWGADLYLNRRMDDPRATAFYLLAAGLPLLASIVMALISITALDALCKVCMGIYLSSAVCFGATGVLFRDAQARPSRGPHISRGGCGVAFGAGTLFVLTSVTAYAAMAPSFERYAGTCGKLDTLADPAKVLVPVGPQQSKIEVIEVLDPLCAACRGFERRFDKLSVAEHTSRRVLLFPLDDTCNWMVDSAVHPGACAISEAVLCAGNDAEKVLAWAFDEQERIVAAERGERGAAQKLAVAKFPALSGCIGTSKARARLNRSLRFAVDHHLPVLTPQLYVNGTRLCDADTDLGLDYMLSKLVERASTGAR
jgi:uncharacterized membrane protein